VRVSAVGRALGKGQCYRQGLVHAAHGGRRQGAEAVAELVLAQLLDAVGVGVSGERVGRESLTQVGRSRAVVVSLIAMMSSTRRLRALLDTTSHGVRP
jgi:hypothetical protein